MSDWELSQQQSNSQSDWVLTPNTQMQQNQNLQFQIPGNLQTTKDILGSALSSTAKSITGIPRGLHYLRENIPQGISQIINQPERAARNVLAGGTELAGDISRIPPSLVNYLSKIGFIKPEIAQQFAQPFSEEEVKNFANKLVPGQQPGDEIIRGAVRNIPEIYTGIGAAKLLNPLQLTAKNITENVLEKGAKAQEKYSGELGKYNTLFNEAKENGLGGFETLNKDKLNIDTIKKYTQKNKIESLKEFNENPTLETGQKAISELGFITRPLDKELKLQGSLPPYKNNLLNKANEAKKHIQESMFSDKFGNVNPEFLSRHQLTQTGYLEEVGPYKWNRYINQYKRGEISARDLVNKLSKGQFIRKKGSEHPQIGIRSAVKSILESTLGKSTMTGVGIGAGYELIKKLLNGENE